RSGLTAGPARHFREMAEPFDAFGDFDKGAKTSQPQHFAAYGVVHIMLLKERFPGIRLELLDSQREALVAGINGENYRLDHRALAEDFARVLDTPGPGKV